MKESELKSQILLELQENFPEGRFFVRPVVGTKINDRFIRSGVAGQADIYGWVKVEKWPVHVEIEIKCSRGKLSPKQILWKKMCEKMNVPFVVGYTPKQTVRDLYLQLDDYKQKYVYYEYEIKDEQRES